MGTCFSSSASAAADQPTAEVVYPDGSLVEYAVPTCVSRVLAPALSFFLCNSSSLRYGLHIKELRADDYIELGQLYFVLPNDKLKHQLSGPHMADLAFRASSSLAGKERKRTNVMQIVEADGGPEEYMRLNEGTVSGISSSPSRSVQKKLLKSETWPVIRTSHLRKLSAIEEIAY